MKMLGGTYGEGHVVYWSSLNELQISPKNAWTPKTRSISEITHFEEINSQTTSSLGKAGIGAAAGFLLAGPLAGIIGLGLGASGGSSTKFVFGIGFSNGDAIMVGANAKDFMNLKSAITPQLSTTQSSSSKKPSTKTAKAKQTVKKGSKFSVIDGRAKKSAPEPNGKLAKQLSKSLEDAETGSNEKEFFELAQKYKRALNDFKWRYFDQLLSDDETVTCVQLAVASAHSSQETWENIAIMHQERLEDGLPERIKMYEEELKKFFGSNLGSKHELKVELARMRAEKRELVDELIPNAKTEAQNYEKRASIFEKIGVELIGEEAVNQGKKTWLGDSNYLLKNDGSLTLLWGKRLFKDVQFEAVNANADDTPQIQAKPANSDVEARLEKLSSLLEKKLITKAEFNQKKKSILDEI